MTNFFEQEYKYFQVGHNSIENLKKELKRIAVDENLKYQESIVTISLEDVIKKKDKKKRIFIKHFGDNTQFETIKLKKAKKDYYVLIAYTAKDDVVSIYTAANAKRIKHVAKTVVALPLAMTGMLIPAAIALGLSFSGAKGSFSPENDKILKRINKTITDNLGALIENPDYEELRN